MRSKRLNGLLPQACTASFKHGAHQHTSRALMTSSLRRRTDNKNSNIIKCEHQQRRHISSSEKKASTATEFPKLVASDPLRTARPAPRSPLAVLPLGMVLRSLATTTVSSNPILLALGLRAMAILAHTTNPVLDPDRNPLLRLFLKKTFYAQFCAGENAAEVLQTIARLKGLGFTGVILGYGKEVVLTNGQASQLGSAKLGEETQEIIQNEIAPWVKGTMETIKLAQPGDFVSLKFTGVGRLALYLLKNRLPATPYLAKSIDTFCQEAQSRGVRLLFDAEQDMLQDGIDDWIMVFARKYNTSPDSATIHGTYQAYKKCTPEVLASHLADAQKNNFTLGVKLVRGAYLGSDPRGRFHDTKADTDACYDAIASSVLTRQWNSTVKGEGKYPVTYLVLATHNAQSVQRARAICASGAAKSDIAFAQLQGMADEISCELVDKNNNRPVAASAEPIQAYKYLVWGTTGECMKYLLRRAHENKDAAQRTQTTRDAMWAEVTCRIKRGFGLA